MNFILPILILFQYAKISKGNEIIAKLEALEEKFKQQGNLQQNPNIRDLSPALP